MQIGRRDFVKSVFGLSGLLLFSPSGLIKAFIPKESPKPGSLLDVVLAELKKQPKGHVAKSIFNVETIINPNTFGTFIRGISIADDQKTLKYLAFLFDEQQYLSDIKFRNNIMKNIYDNLKITWRTENKRWGIAPCSREFNNSLRSFRCTNKVK